MPNANKYNDKSKIKNHEITTNQYLFIYKPYGLTELITNNRIRERIKELENIWKFAFLNNNSNTIDVVRCKHAHTVHSDPLTQCIVVIFVSFVEIVSTDLGILYSPMALQNKAKKESKNKNKN